MRRTFAFAIIMAAILSLLLNTSTARTWYIKVDGTGDAPTIKAGVDSAMAGDTVLVASGDYVEERIFMTKGIVLMSEDGADKTKIIKKPDPFNYPAISVANVTLPTEIKGFWVEGYLDGIFAAITVSSCHDVLITQCIIANNKVGILSNLGTYFRLTHNTFYGNSEYGLYADSHGIMHRNIMWDRAIGIQFLYLCYYNDFMVISDAYPFELDNFSQDPEFCGAVAGNLYLQSDSPCAPGNHPTGENCGLIGPLPVACGSVSVEQKSWGEIKSIYRE